jgi:Cft2 family RNA processing exonuclease
MEVLFSATGIYLPEIRLSLDAIEPWEHGWISHAHSDHARGLPAHAWGTEITLEIYRMRVSPPAESRAPEQHPVRWGEPWNIHGATLTAWPAGHILGAAQLLVEWRGERLLYTGDIKLRAPLCGEATQIVPCDRLIVESTFGLPIYRFLEREPARERMVDFARECLDEGIHPVFIGYPLGRGQEIVHALCEAGVPTAVHGAIARYIPVYERAGYAFPGWEPYEGRWTEGRAYVVLPGLKDSIEASGRNYRLAYVSGWAGLDNARGRVGAEELIPYSDHADFDELLELIRQTGATEVDVVHGYTEAFAGILRKRGIDARAPLRMADESSGEG